ncbi:MAG: helix-turn-helix domain-containing protein [Mycobacteriales bacterium]
MTWKLLTVEETADHLGTSARFVRRLIAERRIAFIRMGRPGAPVRIAEDDIIAFVMSSRVEPTPRRITRRGVA